MDITTKTILVVDDSSTIRVKICDYLQKEGYATVPANVTEFRGVVDGEQWFDVPFSYEPFWSKPRVRVVEEKA